MEILYKTIIGGNMNKEEILENMKNKAGFFKHNNMQIVDLEKAILKTEISNNSLNVYGIAHGGRFGRCGNSGLRCSQLRAPATRLL